MSKNLKYYQQILAKVSFDGILFRKELKKAYATKDLSVIDPALEKINEAWKVASEEMYKAQQEAQANGAAENQDNGSSSSEQAGDNVEDVDFEEVK